MSLLITASFSTQFSAVSAVDRLLGRGFPRERLSLCVDESVGNSGASSSAPTSVVSWVSHKGRRAGQKARELRSPHHATAASRHGYSVLTIEPDSQRQYADAISFLQSAGAMEVSSGEGHLIAENPLVYPLGEVSDAIDVDRAMTASRGVVDEPSSDGDAADSGSSALPRTVRDLIWRDRLAATNL